MIQQIDELEAKGFYRETYRHLEDIFKEWNDGVWSDKWLATKESACQLCGAQAIGISVQMTTLCLTCLNEHPLVPWHPTGSVRPKAIDLLRHSMNCSKHSTSSSDTSVES